MVATRRMTITLIIALLILLAINLADAKAAVRLDDVRWADPRVRNLLRIARCETGYLPGRRPNWHHHNSTYTGALGFAHSTWEHYRRYVQPVPRARYAAQATPREQLAVGLVLIETFGGYSSWPACSRRLGLR